MAFKSGRGVARNEDGSVDARLPSRRVGIVDVAWAGAAAVTISLATLDVIVDRSVLVAVFLFLFWTAVSRIRPLEVDRPWKALEGALLPGAFFLRGAFAIVAYTAKEARGIATYNVDVRAFIFWAAQIADDLPSLLDIRPYHLAGTYDVGFHYFLALVLCLPGGSLLAAQVLVVLAGTVSAWLVFRLARPILGEKAVACGLALAVAPNAIFLASADLMKDCLLTAGFLLAILAARRFYEASRVRPVWLLVLAGSFIVTRSIRVYAGALLEGGLVALPLVAWWRPWRRGASARDRATPMKIVLVLVTLAGCEGALWLAREPPIAIEMALMVGRLKQPEARAAFDGQKGRLEAMLEGASARDNGEILREGKKIEPGGRFSVRHYLFDLLRRFYGPFLWAPPGGDQGFQFLIGNWSAWLEAPIWYALFPFGIAGIFVLARRPRWDAWFVSATVAALFLALVGFSVSHRQRTSNLLPILTISAMAGWLALSPVWRRRVLVAQAGVVATLAAAYWTFRLLHPV
ncbi:MAG: glycosyltransferase family 39 protein [Acidobacteriota bacterium]